MEVRTNLERVLNRCTSSDHNIETIIQMETTTITRISSRTDNTPMALQTTKLQQALRYERQTEEEKKQNELTESSVTIHCGVDALASTIFSALRRCHLIPSIGSSRIFIFAASVEDHQSLLSWMSAKRALRVSTRPRTRLVCLTFCLAVSLIY